MKSSRPAPARRRSSHPRPPEAAPDGRERILAAAIEAFSEVGYEGATTAGIARAAGVAQPLVHHHFGSKEGLWRAAVDVVFSRIPSLPAQTEDRPPRERFIDLIERFVHFVAEQPQATRIISREGATPSARLDYLLRNHVHEPFREVVDLLRAGQVAGVVRTDIRPELCLFLVLGAGSHLFDVSALAARSQGIDTTSDWTREEFKAVLRAMLEGGLFKKKT